ncbi:MAG: DUF4834 family protein [Prevotellaceae bacterium]|nr:DUF4834 family protein [Prevotellaceae bacterium]
MKVLLIILLSILVLQWLVKRLMPYLILRFVQRHVGKQFGSRPSAAKKEGKVYVNRTITTEKKIDKNLGEYVEYEEIT